MILLANSIASGSLPWAFWPGPSLAAPVRYRFDVSKPVPISVEIAMSGDKVRLEDAGEGRTDVTFRCDTETFLLLINGRLAPSPAITNGRLAVEGDSGMAADFGQWFKGI
jgi:predicted lipid carrier protein YhbT